MFAALARRYGSSVISVNLPGIGHAVVISDPALAKDLFNTSTDLIERPTSGAGVLGDAFGPGSTFSLAGDELLERRKIVAPPFHGKRMRSYDRIIEEEVMREIATWPEGREFETLPVDDCGSLSARSCAPCSAPRVPRWTSFVTLVPAMVTLGSPARSGAADNAA